MTILTVNTINNTSGTNILPSTGSIIQTAQFGYSDVFESFTGNTTFDMPGIFGGGASITPFNSSSRILFSMVIHCGQEDTWRNNFFRTYYRIGSGSWNQFGANCAGYSWVGSINGVMNSIGSEFLLPTLSTTSTVSFKVTQTGHTNGGFLHLNQNNTTNDQTARNTVNCTSTITLYEISA